MATIGRRAYAEQFGPTTGDRLRLADTGLVIEIEKDLTGNYAVSYANAALAGVVVGVSQGLEQAVEEGGIGLPALAAIDLGELGAGGRACQAAG